MSSRGAHAWPRVGRPEYASTSVVASSDVGEVEEDPTEMQVLGEGQEIPDKLTVTPVGTTGCDRDQEVPFRTSALTRAATRWPFFWLTRHDSPMATQDEPPSQETS